MKLLMIHAWNEEEGAYRGRFSGFFSYPSLTLASIYPLIPKGVFEQIDVVDENSQKVEYYKEKYDVVMLTFETSSSYSAYKHCDEFRKRGAYVVCGGYHTTALPDEVAEHSDTVESIRATCDFAIKNKFTFAAFNILMPYPNTPLYEKMEREGRLLYNGKWWLHEDYRFNYASIVPKNMTADELTEISFDCRRRFNSPKSIFTRALEPRTNMRTPYRFATYLIYNPLFRKEVFKKQGMRFGLKTEEK